MDTSVEIEANLHPLGLCRLDALQNLIKLFVGANPVELGRRIHFDCVEPLSPSPGSRFTDLVRSVAADPRIGPDLVAHPAAKHLPSGNVQPPALEVPERLLEARQRRHDDCPAA